MRRTELRISHRGDKASELGFEEEDEEQFNREFREIMRPKICIHLVTNYQGAHYGHLPFAYFLLPHSIILLFFITTCLNPFQDGTASSLRVTMSRATDCRGRPSQRVRHYFLKATVFSS